MYKIGDIVKFVVNCEGSDTMYCTKEGSRFVIEIGSKWVIEKIDKHIHYLLESKTGILMFLEEWQIDEGFNPFYLDLSYMKLI